MLRPMHWANHVYQKVHSRIPKSAACQLGDGTLSTVEETRDLLAPGYMLQL
jgi:hypothetical protein